MVVRRVGAAMTLLALVACGDDTKGVGGAGGTSSTSSGNSSGSVTACDALPCTDNDEDASNDCISCSVIGDPAIQGGSQCAAAFTACFGDGDAECTNGDPECCGFADCLVNCPADDANTPNNENLDCLCANDGTNCTNMPVAGTCVGDYADGVQPYLTIARCVFEDVCTQSCAE